MKEGRQRESGLISKLEIRIRRSIRSFLIRARDSPRSVIAEAKFVVGSVLLEMLCQTEVDHQLIK
jgi:hypothetical protein